VSDEPIAFGQEVEVLVVEGMLLKVRRRPESIK